MIPFLKALSDFNESELQSHLEYMRTLRNSCRHLMTRCQDEISPEQQQLWHQSLDENTVPYMYLAQEHGVVIYSCGYGLINYENDCAYLTAALAQDDRGKGLGRKIFTDLINVAKQKANKICLEVLETNTTALNLYQSLGFVQINQKDNVIFLEMNVNV